jgi:hypothetical protein
MVDSNTADTTSANEGNRVSKMTASQNVLDTYELLESILLALPIDDILFAAKVNTSKSISNDLEASLLTQPCTCRSRRTRRKGEWYETLSFPSADIIIRRLRDCEAIGVIPTTPPKSQWIGGMRCCPFTRAMVVDGKDPRLRINRKVEQKLQGWEFEL